MYYVMGNWIDFIVHVHLVARLCVHCCNVFNSVYAQSMWFCLYRCFPPVWPCCNIRCWEGCVWRDWCNAACRFVCFMGSVLDALMGREGSDKEGDGMFL